MKLNPTYFERPLLEILISLLLCTLNTMLFEIMSRYVVERYNLSCCGYINEIHSSMRGVKF